MARTRWSEYIEAMIPTGFTFKGRHYTWNEDDLVYWRDDVDDRYFEYEGIPKNAVLD